MSSDILNNSNLLVAADEIANPQSPYVKLLDNVQSHVLKDNGRDHSVHLILKFKKANSAKVRMMIEQLARATYPFPNTSERFHYLASTKEQLLIGSLVKGTPADDSRRRTYVVNMYLSKRGYEALGFSGAQVPPGLTPRNSLMDFLLELVRIGKLSADRLGDVEHRFDEIHAMIVIGYWKAIPVAGDKISLEDSVLQKLIDDFDPYVNILGIEIGKVLYDSNDPATNEVIEHFGFRDGISVPVFFKEEWDDRLKNDIYPSPHWAGFQKFDPATPLRLVLADDPNYQRDNHAFGSYLVFGKLEQNVRSFEEDIHKLASILAGQNKLERARALIMGRFRDGTPLTEQGQDGGLFQKDNSGRPLATKADSPNDFDYFSDRWTHTGAGRCPIHSHIRRANPRGETGIDGKDRKIVRRGIPYGHRDKEPKDNPSLDELPERDVGLLFMCFQADIKEQFEHIMDQWCLYNDHRDAAIRDERTPASDETKMYNKWPIDWYPNPETSTVESQFCPIKQHVYFKGGEYFFAPSVKFLREITTK